ncbi:DoxX family membrane protein [Chlamydiota bacterium]
MAARGESSSVSDVEKKRWIAIMRIYLGFFFLISSLDKFKSAYFDKLFLAHVRSAAANTTILWFKDFLTNIVGPRYKFFAFLNAAGEFVVGLALIFGFIAGLFSIIAILIRLAHFLGSMALAPVILNTNLIYIIALLVLIGSCSGRTWGMDKHLSKKILFKYLL